MWPIELGRTIASSIHLYIPAHSCIWSFKYMNMKIICILKMCQLDNTKVLTQSDTTDDFTLHTGISWLLSRIRYIYFYICHRNTPIHILYFYPHSNNKIRRWTYSNCYELQWGGVYSQTRSTIELNGYKLCTIWHQSMIQNL